MDDLQYYKKNGIKTNLLYLVLNLVINGWPSILSGEIQMKFLGITMVLNLVINGWPSIQIM